MSELKKYAVRIIWPAYVTVRAETESGAIAQGMEMADDLFESERIRPYVDSVTEIAKKFETLAKVSDEIVDNSNKGDNSDV
jgi:hypothetical protein